MDSNTDISRTGNVYRNSHWKAEQVYRKRIQDILFSNDLPDDSAVTPNYRIPFL